MGWFSVGCRRKKDDMNSGWGNTWDLIEVMSTTTCVQYRGGTYSLNIKKLRLRRLVEVSSVCDGNWGLSPLSNGLRRDICLLIAMPAAPCVSRGVFCFPWGVKLV